MEPVVSNHWMRAVRPLLGLCWLALLAAAPAAADIIDTSPQGFTIRTSVQVARPPDRAYAALVDVGQWWGKEHTYTGDSRNMTIDARPGGCFCEKLPGGGGVEHGRVVNAAPGSLLRIDGALGPLQEMAVTGSLTWHIAASGSGSTVTMTYTVGGYVPGGVGKLAAVVDQVLGQQVAFLKAYLEARA
jgi:uncharacterized protein YndB with AHSA1/START domain